MVRMTDFPAITRFSGEILGENAYLATTSALSIEDL
jgi:hypothetical protein